MDVRLTSAPTAETQAQPAKLNYFRCFDCLEIATLQDKPKVSYQWFEGKRRTITTDIACPCNGTVEWLGTTTEDKKKLAITALKPACDGRCTEATGPNCYCKCGCVNHGSGRMVEVVKLKDKPTMKYKDSKSAILRGLDYRDMVKQLTAEINKINYYPNGAYDYKLANQKYNAESELKQLRRLTNTKNRIERANKLFESLTGQKLQLFSELMHEAQTEREGTTDGDMLFALGTMPEAYYAF